MKKFLLKYYKTEDVLIKTVDRNLVVKFQHFLKVEKFNNYNQVMKYSQNLKKLTKMAQFNSWLTHDPFATIALTVKEVSRPSLTESELKAIIEQKLEKESIARVRDMFVFACFTGLAHADVRKLKQSELELNPNGKQWIRIARKKTKFRAHISVLAVVDQIIQKYVNYSSNSDSPILPAYTNQNTNRYLKVIARNAGIEKNL
jgi:site-specific recombinase XerD